MLYFLRRGTERRICETRLRADAPGYELVITDGDARHVEVFEELAQMLAREHELVQAWRAQGWQEEAGPRGKRG